MKQKGGLAVVLIVLIILLTIVNILIISRVTLESQPFISGGATSSQGTVSFCNNKPPSFSINNQIIDAGEDEVFTLQVNASDPGGNNDTLNYYDNTSLFTINGSGYISFDPDEDTSNQFVKITVQDESSCANQNTSVDFLLSFDAAPLIVFTNPLGSIND
ncbi:MAG: hypothetical protein AABX05_01185, partial [Nanoarchaeota archaeon]